MTRFRFDINGTIYLAEKDFFGALMADPSGEVIDRMLEALDEKVSAGDLFSDGVDGWDLAAAEDLTITVTDEKSGAALLYISEETWEPHEHAEPAEPGYIRMLSAAAHQNGESTVTRLVGELSVEDFRVALAKGFNLRLVLPGTPEAAAPDLLEALEAIAAGAPLTEPLPPSLTSSLTDWATRSEHYRLAQIARAALAKAKGETK